MPIIAIVRPGQTEFDEQERIQGDLNLPLNDAGRAETDEIIERLRDLAIDQIFTSPTDPAFTTALQIGEALGVSVKEIEVLANVDYGLWEGLCLDEIKRKQPKVFKQWQDAPESICPPEGETCAEALQRARKGLKRPMKRKGGYAIVSLDPMAALIESVITGEAPRLPKPGKRGERSHVELIEVAPQAHTIMAEQERG
jgi:probable phosphoglycerate mutase